jgi:D-sedoheptulose 7-phosphate isomerase
LIQETAKILASAVDGNGRIFIAGNGGSHQLAEHLCAELVGRRDHSASPIGAFVLQNCRAVNSALANDLAFEDALARELVALCRPGDTFIAISGSGESRNLVAAANAAVRAGVTTLGLVGTAESTLGRICRMRIATPSSSIASVQQVHLVAIHLLWLALEEALAGSNARSGQ